MIASPYRSASGIGIFLSLLDFYPQRERLWSEHSRKWLSLIDLVEGGDRIEAAERLNEEHGSKVMDICKMSLLYVDDDFDVSRMVVSKLKANYPMQNILYAENPMEALRIISRQEPDIFLLDILMPYIGGDEFARFLNRTFPCQPILFISVCRDKATVDRCMASGASGFFAKPINFGQLFDAIDALMVQAFYRRFHRGRRKAAVMVG